MLPQCQQDKTTDSNCAGERYLHQGGSVSAGSLNVSRRVFTEPVVRWSGLLGTTPQTVEHAENRSGGGLHSERRSVDRMTLLCGAAATAATAATAAAGVLICALASTTVCVCVTFQAVREEKEQATVLKTTYEQILRGLQR